MTSMTAQAKQAGCSRLSSKEMGRRENRRFSGKMGWTKKQKKKFFSLMLCSNVPFLLVLVKTRKNRHQDIPRGRESCPSSRMACRPVQYCSRGSTSTRWGKISQPTPHHANVICTSHQRIGCCKINGNPTFPKGVKRPGHAQKSGRSTHQTNRRAEREGARGIERAGEKREIGRKRGRGEREREIRQREAETERKRMTKREPQRDR